MSKKVIVIGASSGIGAEIAKELLKSGAYVTLVARREEELHKLVAEIPSSKYCIIKHDVSHFAEAPKFFADAIKIMEGLDEIYYCAGILEKVAIDEFSVEKDIRMLTINTLGAFAWLNSAADYFQKKNSGKIIGISSIAGDRGRVGSPAYNTSKAALNTYLESLRNRLARKGIQVLTVKPGFIETDMTKSLTPEQQEKILQQIPMTRMGQGMDIALAVHFLISEGASYITGETIHVNGGMLMN